MKLSFLLGSVPVGGVCACAIAANPFSSFIVSYAPGTNPIPGYTNPLVALGEPARFTPDPDFPSAVTPFASAYKPEQVVSLGAGGSLVLGFDQPIVNDPSHLFGIDLLVFSNSFFYDPDTFGDTAVAMFAGGGTVEVSQDGTTWHTIPAVAAEGLFPTLGYSDLTNAFATTPGAVPSDFTKPVNPAFDPFGKTFAQIAAAYDGSGGGAGVDLGAAGLSSVQFVRISNPVGAPMTIEVDAVSVVPVPGSGVVLGAAALLISRRRR